MPRFKLISGQIFLVLLLLCPAVAQDEAKKKVTSQSDLPRFSYPLTTPASELVQADSATFDAFSNKLRADLDGVFRDYDIADKASMRNLLFAKMTLQQLAGEYPEALQTVKAVRAIEDKPSAKLTSGLLVESELAAAIEANSTSGSAYEQAFTKSY